MDGHIHFHSSSGQGFKQALRLQKTVKVEVEYEANPDGQAVVCAIVLKRRVNYNGQGEYEPYDEEFRIGADWLSRSTLNDLATEIQDDLLDDAVDSAWEAKRDREINRYLDARASGPMHYEGVPV